MIRGLDSAQPPTPSRVAAARGAGYRIWSGYIATRRGLGLLRPWSQLEFEVARACGSTPIAYCSGWDDPAALKALAAAWNVRLCLDVESGIRDQGPWMQAWLDASGAGLYGMFGVHTGIRAAFYVLGRYPGSDPGLTWPDWAPRPSGPCAWQWQGGHDEFGVGVDSTWLDDWFAGGSAAAPQGTGDASVALTQDPVDPNRLDLWVVGQNGNLYHTWSESGLPGLITSQMAPDNYGGQLAPGQLTVSQSPDGSVFNVVGAAPDGSVWAIAPLKAGGVAMGWTKVGSLVAALPSGSPGPKGDPGPAYDDTAIKAELATIAAKVARVKGDL